MDQQPILVDTCGCTFPITLFACSHVYRKHLVVSAGVQREIQGLAWSPDPEDQEAAHRAGFALQRFCDLSPLTLTLDTRDSLERHIDDDLLRFAEQDQMPIFTADRELMDRARERDIQVISAQSMWRDLTPDLIKLLTTIGYLLPVAKDDVLTLRILQCKGYGEYVGYLDDGRKIVVQEAWGLLDIDEYVRVHVTHIKDNFYGGQTIFAVLEDTT